MPLATVSSSNPFKPGDLSWEEFIFPASFRSLKISGRQYRETETGFEPVPDTTATLCAGVNQRGLLRLFVETTTEA